jgi:hypothetical protein
MRPKHLRINTGRKVNTDIHRITQPLKNPNVTVVPLRIMSYGRKGLDLALKYGWFAGARYTNLRTIRGIERIGLIDIDWKNYDFDKHLLAVRLHRPHLTVAMDILSKRSLPIILKQASVLKKWADKVIIVPKDLKLGRNFTRQIPKEFILGYSVPSSYGGTTIPLDWFEDREVHLLGGRPDTQFELATKLNVHSLDSNRIAVDARYGRYFDGSKFKKHPSWGFYECLDASLSGINKLWQSR